MNEENNIQNDMIIHEWGWLFDIFSVSQQSMKLLLRDINLESTQSTILLLMATMRKISQIEYYYTESSSDPGNLAKFKQGSLLQIMNNLQIIWSSIITLSPTVILDIKIEQRDSLTGLGRKRMRSSTPTVTSSPSSSPPSSMDITIDYFLQEVLGVHYYHHYYYHYHYYYHHHYYYYYYHHHHMILTFIIMI
jgi:hypothetical protein